MASTVTQVSSPDAKIRLFRSRFGGRDDVYAKRYQSQRTGRSGYSPVCSNEWVRGVCDKPRTKCAKCPHRRLEPLTDSVIHGHLTGEHVVGLYPMLRDETCTFLAADFDKAAWCDDIQATIQTCHELNIPAAIERSRSGKGAHLWIFFAEAIPAVMAAW